MDNSPPNDSHLDDAEARMRRALGLDGNSTPITHKPQPTARPADHSSQRRKFVRDGEVQVEIVHRGQHQSNGDGNPLDALRQNIRTLAATKERVERSLAQAQEAITHLQTTLGHERLARDEAIARAEADRKAVQQVLESARAELVGEKIAHERSEQALRDAQSTITGLTEKLHDAQQALAMATAGRAAERQQAQNAARKPLAIVPTDTRTGGDKPVQTARRLLGGGRDATIVATVKNPIRAAGKHSGRSVVGDEGNGRKKIAEQRENAPKPVKWW